ncbi:MAG TPA: carbohydrate ABC transporter permease, partial [Ilumatobacteraceae bacterium]|nr:carbohydrate ABC transporter permease [Ilumatobacteraceae bacterium]
MPTSQISTLERTSGWAKFGRYSLLTLIAVIVLLPVYAVVMQAFKTGAGAMDHPRSLLPVDLTTETIRVAWTKGDMGTLMRNSLVMSVLVTIGVLATSLLSAYAFAFLEFPFKRTLFALFLATMLVPAEVTILINKRTIDSFGWKNSMTGLTVPLMATALGTFLIRQVFLQVPSELREAAALDGLGHGRFLYEVAAPLSRPTLGALGLLSFLTTWNQYLWPQTIIDDTEHRTLQIGLSRLSNADINRLNLVTAGTVIAAIPIVILL